MATVPAQDEDTRLAIASEWTRVGGGFTVPAAQQPVDIEDLLLRSAIQAPADYRLFFVAASWLGVHHHLVDMRRLSRKLEELEAHVSAVAGALLSVANEIAHAPRLEAAARHCRRLDEPRPLFERVAQNPVLHAHARENSLPLFRRWGLWHDEISLKLGAIRPVKWILATCPELRIRALVGANLDAEVMEALRHNPATVASLARHTGATYSATHEAATRLRGRGLVEEAGTEGERRLVLPEQVRLWLETFPIRESQQRRPERGVA